MASIKQIETKDGKRFFQMILRRATIYNSSIINNRRFRMPAKQVFGICGCDGTVGAV